MGHELNSPFSHQPLQNLNFSSYQINILTMVIRRSPRRSKAPEEPQPEKMEVDEDDDAPEEAPASSSNRSERASARASRKKRGGDLRSKSVGLVGKIDTEQTSGRKITFGDDFAADEESKEEENEEEEEEDDDDQVEEVTASVAKEQAMEQLQQERKTAIKTQKLDTKRKRKIVEKQEEEMDEDFFATLDAELDQERKEKRQVKITPKGKHTTFVSKDETDAAVEGEHNIEVVVLGSQAAVAAASGSKPSEAALVFSRSELLDGISTIKKSGTSKKKPPKTVGWKRSNKMSRVLTASKKERRGTPAAHFVIKA